MKKGEKFKIFRVKFNLSREAMSDVLGISTRTYQKIESGEREIKLSELKKLSDHYEINMHEFLVNE